MNKGLIPCSDDFVNYFYYITHKIHPKAQEEFGMKPYNINLITNPK